MSVSILTTDAQAPAANTAAVITLVAVPEQRQKLRFVAWSYSAAPTGGALTITGLEGGATWEVAITAAGPGAMIMPQLTGRVNTDVVITLATGGGTVVGRLNVSSEKGYGY